MVYLAPPNRWQLWFGLRFFIDPSGGHPPPFTLWMRLTESPLAGHTFGSFLAWLSGKLLWRFAVHGRALEAAAAPLIAVLGDWSMWWWIVFCQVAWQASALHRRVYSPETAIGQAGWRILIGAVAGLPVVFL